MAICVYPSGLKGGSLGKKKEDLIYAVSAFMIEQLKLGRFKAVVQVKQSRSRKLFNNFACGYASMDIVDTDNGKIKWGIIELTNMNREEFISTLIHEWVHMKQYMRGELSMDGATWKKIDESKKSYYQQSCEKEAFKLQKKYYKMWLTSKYV